MLDISFSKASFRNSMFILLVYNEDKFFLHILIYVHIV